MADDFVFPECPSCGGDVYDNRQKNAERKAQGLKPMPKFACKANCGWKKWEPKGQGGGGGFQGSGGRSGGNTGSVARAPKFTWDSLEQTYAKCLNMGSRQVKRLADAGKLTFTMSDVLAAAATCFMAATKEGVADVEKSE